MGGGNGSVGVAVQSEGVSSQTRGVLVGLLSGAAVTLALAALAALALAAQQSSNETSAASPTNYWAFALIEASGAVITGVTAAVTAALVASYNVKKLEASARKSRQAEWVREAVKALTTGSEAWWSAFFTVFKAASELRKRGPVIEEELNALNRDRESSLHRLSELEELMKKSIARDGTVAYEVSTEHSQLSEQIGELELNLEALTVEQAAIPHQMWRLRDRFEEEGRLWKEAARFSEVIVPELRGDLDAASRAITRAELAVVGPDREKALKCIPDVRRALDALYSNARGLVSGPEADDDVAAARVDED
jgi:hypothetical protein